MGVAMGPSCGVTPSGSSTSRIFSRTRWRALVSSTPSSKVRVTKDKPKSEMLRSRNSPGVPFKARSSGAGGDTLSPELPLGTARVYVLVRAVGNERGGGDVHASGWSLRVELHARERVRLEQPVGVLKMHPDGDAVAFGIDDRGDRLHFRVEHATRHGSHGDARLGARVDADGVGLEELRHDPDGRQIGDHHQVALGSGVDLLARKDALLRDLPGAR